MNIILRPNSAINGRWRLFIFALLLPVFALIGIGFARHGAWPVIPALLLTLLALGWGLGYVERHAGDFEQITLHDGQLSVIRHAPGADQRYDFSSHWVQVVPQAAAPGVKAHLALRSHGRDLPIGVGLSDDERAIVTRELNTWLRYEG